MEIVLQESQILWGIYRFVEVFQARMLMLDENIRFSKRKELLPDYQL